MILFLKREIPLRGTVMDWHEKLWVGRSEGWRKTRLCTWSVWSLKLIILNKQCELRKSNIYPQHAHASAPPGVQTALDKYITREDCQ